MQYVDGKGDDLCKSVGDHGTLSNCTVYNTSVLTARYDTPPNPAVPTLKLTAAITADLRSMVVSVLKGCPAGMCSVM